jgi:hypothetical protein
MEAPGYFAALARTAAAFTWLAGCGALATPRPAPIVAPEITVAPPPLAVEAPDATEAVILVTIDGARWQEIYGGVDARLAKRAGMADGEIVPADRLLPNLYSLIARGVAIGAPGHGAAISASGPVFISLPGYMELLSGGTKSGCRDNSCPAITRPTLADDVRDTDGAVDGDVAMIASWPTLERAAARAPGRITISAGRHGGASRDALRVDEEASALLDLAADSPPWPGGEDYRPDVHTRDLALRYLSARHPRFLFVGLGDTDEHAHADNYRGYLDALRQSDAFVGRIVETLGARARKTTVVVTADHGRSADFANHGRDPESARVFLIAAGGAVPARGFVSSSRQLHLSDVAPTLRALMGIESGERPAMAELLPEMPLVVAEVAR